LQQCQIPIHKSETNDVKTKQVKVSDHRRSTGL
jgi:hypothetical protein